MLSPVRVSAGSPVAVDHDLAVAASLEAIAAGTVTAIGELYDLLGEEVWTVSLIITDDVAAAERATIGSFVQVLRTPGVVPRDAAAARRWMLRTACRVADSISATRRQG